jgi:drug/metabolite transporter (DMT)-like permease
MALLKTGLGKSIPNGFSTNEDLSQFLRIFHEWTVYGAILCFIISNVLWIYILAHKKVVIALPVQVGLMITINFFSAFWLLGEAILVREVIGGVFIILGVFLVSGIFL